MRLEDIKKEIENESTIYLEISDIYLTKNYIVTSKKKCKAIAYKDIVSIQKRVFINKHGLISSLKKNYLLVLTSDGKKHKIAAAHKSYSHDIHKQIINACCNKNQNIKIEETSDTISSLLELGEFLIYACTDSILR